MSNLDGLDHAVLVRIDEIIENAVQQGQAPGVVAAVARGQSVPSRDLTVVVLSQRAADQAGIPAVCDDVLAAARATL